MAISAAMVNELRRKTGAGMMDCKKALVETNGDFESAIDWLRTKGLAAAAKKAGRVAAEGLVAVRVDGNVGAAVEINSETDFVSKNQQFQKLVAGVANRATSCNDLEELKAAESDQKGTNIGDLITENIATIGENLNLRRMERLEVKQGVIASYVHNSVAEDMGKIAVLVALESSANTEKLQEVGKQIAMHIAAAKPLFLTKEEVDPALVQREREIFIEQARESGKPDNIIEKMVEGRIRKFLEEVVLLEQVFVIDTMVTISEYLAQIAKELGAPVRIASYVSFELGQGIEKAESNFAEEVAAVSKG